MATPVLVTVKADSKMFPVPELFLAQGGSSGPLVPDGPFAVDDDVTQFMIDDELYIRSTGTWTDKMTYSWSLKVGTLIFAQSDNPSKTVVYDAV